MFLWNIAVTSLAEVWIEIYFPVLWKHWSLSLPLRKCGLKSSYEVMTSSVLSSLPLRKCGLKYRNCSR